MSLTMPHPRWGVLALVAVVLTGSLVGPGGAVAPVESQESTTSRPLYWGGTGTLDIAAFRADRAGKLSEVPGSPFPTGMGLTFLIAPDGRTMYVASLVEGDITAYRIGSDGALRALADASIPLGGPVVGMALTPDGRRLFATVAGAGTSVHSFTVTRSGPLVRTGAPVVAVPGSLPLSLPAVTPDGRFLYVEDWRLARITTFAVGRDAQLTQVGDPVTTGAGPLASNSGPAYPTLTPNGRYLYLSDEQGGTVSGFVIGRDGRLTPTPGSPYAAGQSPHGTAITRDGRRMYVPDSLGGVISGFAIAADGSLRSLPGSPYASQTPGSLLGRSVLSHDGRRLFQIEALSTSVTSEVHSYRVKEDGRLVPTGLPASDTGVVFSDGPSGHFVPNQGPAAALTLVDVRGRTRVFSAAASHDSDGTVARYLWRFGDGTTAVTTTPRVSHTYAGAGARRVIVRLVDDEGCSTRPIHTGIMLTCNGGPRARAVLAIR